MYQLSPAFCYINGCFDPVSDKYSLFSILLSLCPVYVVALGSWGDGPNRHQIAGAVASQLVSHLEPSFRVCRTREDLNCLEVSWSGELAQEHIDRGEGNGRIGCGDRMLHRRQKAWPAEESATATKTSTATKDPRSTATSESTPTTTATNASRSKKSTPSTTRTTRRSSSKANSRPASDPKTSSSAPIDRKPAAKKQALPLDRRNLPSRLPAPPQDLPNPPSAPSQTLGDNNKAKSDKVGAKSRLRNSTSNPAAERPTEPRTPSTESKSISHSESTELAGKQNAAGRRQPEAGNTVQATEEISEPPAQSACGRETTIEPKRTAEQTPPPTNPVNATTATVQDSKILIALVAR
ncbi:hypothetical protein ACJ73_04866 [Blastomyces percursus]|uniref:Uncharacterized protein n=1 Tax=Blastomyces percursus TaxID=1658174 RepID=A0A1J9QU72_9EURO|nr:hypothetical protein ACJ73_04866 [Blastomyces percursus]